MSVTRIGGRVGSLNGAGGAQTGGALGDHTVEQIANTRAEPRETSIGSAIKSFFKGIGDFFSKLKADFKESRAAEREVTLRNKASAAADAVLHKLADNKLPTMELYKLLVTLGKLENPDDVVGGAVEKMLHALHFNLSFDEQDIARPHLINFNEPGGLADQMVHTFDTILDIRETALHKLGAWATLGSGPRPEDHDDMRATFAQDLADIGAALPARLTNVAWA